MLIVDAQVYIRSQSTPSGQHRQISSCRAENCLKEIELVMGHPGSDLIASKLPNSEADFVSEE